MQKQSPQPQHLLELVSVVNIPLRAFSSAMVRNRLGSSISESFSAVGLEINVCHLTVATVALANVHHFGVKNVLRIDQVVHISVACWVDVR